jgi:threonine dehydrogenase-like Zn-dependent dehydrogenase
VLPTSWQAVEYAGIPDGGSAAIYGLWPVGDMSSRIARHRGYRVIAVDLVAERIERACRNGVEVIVANDHDVPGVIREMTDGRGPTR